MVRECNSEKRKREVKCATERGGLVRKEREPFTHRKSGDGGIWFQE